MNKKYHLLTQIIVVILLAISGSCKNDDDPETTTLPPEITSFTPESDVVGSEVTITGKNFSDQAEDIEVAFNGAVASITSATTTQVVVVIPADATTGKITVKIDGLTATSADDFVVLEDPALTGFSPSIGAPGVSVIITGTNFPEDEASIIVKFNGKTATLTEVTTTSLTVTVPAEATTGKITVTIGSKTLTSADDFEICTGKAELIVTNVAITGKAAKSVTITFDILNAGSASLDLTQWVLQTYLSTDGVNPGDPAGGFILDNGGTLQTGEHYSTGWTSNSAADLSTYSHIVISAEVKAANVVDECTTTNNTVFKPLD